MISFRSAVFSLVIANVFLFALTLAVPNFGSLLIYSSSSEIFNPLSFVTYMFAHANFSHLFFNMFALIIFGSLVEPKIGTKRFLMLYFGAGILAALLGSLIYDSFLGASAGVMGIIGATIVFFPRLKVLLFFVIPMPMWFLGVIYVIYDLLGTYMPNNTANFAHLVGMAVGFAYAYYLLSRRKKFVKKFSRPKKTEENKDPRFISLEEAENYNKAKLDFA